MTKIRVNALKAKNLVTGEEIPIPVIGGGGGGSSVTMTDNPDGGVDITVDDETRTLATEAEVKTDLSEISDDVKSHDVRLNDIDGMVDLHLVIGTMSFSSTGITYVTTGTVASKRVITKEGYSIHLNVGDKIGLTSYDGLRFSIGWFSKSENTWKNIQSRSADYIVAEESDYAVRINRLEEVVLDDVNELGQYLFVEKESYTNKKVEEIASKIDKIAYAISTIPLFEIGGINSDGSNSDSVVRARTSYYLDVSSFNFIEADEDIRYAIKGYTLDSSVPILSTDWLSGKTDILALIGLKNVSRVRVYCKKTTDTTIASAYEMSKKIRFIGDGKTNDNMFRKEIFPKFEMGNLTLQGIPEETQLTIRARTSDFVEIDNVSAIACDLGVRFSMRFYNDKCDYVARTDWLTSTYDVYAQLLTHPNYKYLKVCMSYSPEAQVSNITELVSKLHFIKISETDSYSVNKKISVSKRIGNLSIRCAKEIMYSDGTAPVIDYFLLEEPFTNKFYFSKDLVNKEYAFTFQGLAYKYSFGILENGDVIAVLDAESIEQSSAKNDANRLNPYVFLACENWEIQHEVEFGDSLKPCGWLENCGFRSLPDGSVIFCEYTRQSTATSNAWKLSGNPLNKNNWVNTKQFVITSTDNATGFKHCHTVQYDFYTGIAYLATGDDNIGAMLFYSTDNGVTWTQLRSPDSTGDIDEHGWYRGSEKYCRLLSFTFTEDYIYWASDTAVAVNHYVFKARRGVNGILDYSTVEEYLQIPKVSTVATYGTAYIPEYNAMLLIERDDATSNEMPVRLVDFNTNELVTIGYMKSAKGTPQSIGFRTRFSEWYPIDGLVRFGFATRQGMYNNATNQNKGFGNAGEPSSYYGTHNINNLSLKVVKANNEYKMVLGTYYI